MLVFSIISLFFLSTKLCSTQSTYISNRDLLHLKKSSPTNVCIAAQDVSFLLSLNQYTSVLYEIQYDSLDCSGIPSLVFHSLHEEVDLASTYSLDMSGGISFPPPVAENNTPPQRQREWKSDLTITRNIFVGKNCSESLPTISQQLSDSCILDDLSGYYRVLSCDQSGGEFQTIF
jgi:hypothetical protein